MPDPNEMTADERARVTAAVAATVWMRNPNGRIVPVRRDAVQARLDIGYQLLEES